MLRRYPHTGKIIVVTEVGAPGGLNTETTAVFDVQGRFEPAASKSGGIDYRAKFYCKNIDYLIRKFIEEGLFPEDLISQNDNQELKPFSVDGQTFKYNGKNFEIVMLHNYQTHCEIWLE